MALLRSKMLMAGAFLALTTVPAALAERADRASLAMPRCLRLCGQAQSPLRPGITGVVPAAVALADDSTHDTNANLHQSLSPQNLPSPEQIKKDRWTAYRLAHSLWLDKAAAANPRIVAAICAHPGPAKVLAQHRHIAQIADADHYLCRRLTRWPAATQKLIRNKNCDHVIMLDPEGIYSAVEKHPQVARMLARDPMFQDMVCTNPQLAKVITQHMH